MAKYSLNEEKMFADITDGVAIVINSETGVYYGMNGFGTAIFENLINGAETKDILAALKAIPNIAPDIEIRFQAFIDAIVEKELVIQSEISGEIVVNINPTLAFESNFVLGVNEYNDAQELLLADPIHEVKEDTGWSPEKSALNPDQEDVERREAKMK